MSFRSGSMREQYTFGDITGRQHVFPTEVLAAFSACQGEVTARKLDEALQRHRHSYYDRGYIYAQSSPEVPAIPCAQYRFSVSEANRPASTRSISSQHPTRRKYPPQSRSAGDTFSRTLLERSQREVWMLNYFGNVEPNVKPIDEEKVDLEFKVEEKSTDTANMSAGYSEVDKFIGSIGLAMANLFGNGQRLSTDWNFGRYYRSFNISFTEPWLRDTPTLAGASVYDTKRDAAYYGYKQESRGFRCASARSELAGHFSRD